MNESSVNPFTAWAQLPHTAVPDTAFAGWPKPVRDKLIASAVGESVAQASQWRAFDNEPEMQEHFNLSGLQYAGVGHLPVHAFPVLFMTARGFARVGADAPLTLGRTIGGQVRTAVKIKKDSDDGKSKPAQYFTLTGPGLDQPNAPYVGPLAGKAVADPTRPLVITEGPLKGASLETQGIPAIALNGVYNVTCRVTDGLVVDPDTEEMRPRRDDDPEARVFHPSLEAFTWKGRDVVIAFDGDVMIKPQVKEACRRLAALLEGREARVWFAHLPTTLPGSDNKCGIDDFLAELGPKEFVDTIRDYAPGEPTLLRQALMQGHDADADWAEAWVANRAARYARWVADMKTWMVWRAPIWEPCGVPLSHLSSWLLDEARRIEPEVGVLNEEIEPLEEQIAALKEEQSAYDKDDDEWKELAAEVGKLTHEINGKSARRDAVKRIEKTIRDARSRRRMEAIAAVAADLSSPMRIMTADLDPNPHAIPMSNGMLRLDDLDESGAPRLVPHAPEMLSTIKPGCEWRGLEATSPLLDALLEALPDFETRTFLQWIVGADLLGTSTSYRWLVQLVGPESNGKTLLMDAIHGAFGDSVRLLTDEVLGGTEPGAPSPGQMKLRGCRLGYLEEVPGDIIRAHQLKRLVGTPTLSARELHKGLVTWRATHSLMLITNDVVQIAGGDAAAYGRVQLLKFPFTFTDDPTLLEMGEQSGYRPRNPALAAAVKSREPDLMAAVAAWAVRGSLDYLAAQEDPERRQLGRGLGMPLPREVERETSRWRGDVDAAASLAEYLEVTGDPTHFLPNDDLKILWTFTSDQTGRSAPSARTVNDRVSKAEPLRSALARGDVTRPNSPRKVGGRSVRGWAGVRLTAAGHAVVAQEPVTLIAW